jgi:hypothetical protein
VSDADRFPTVMVRNARIHRMFVIAGARAGKGSSFTREYEQRFERTFGPPRGIAPKTVERFFRNGKKSSGIEGRSPTRMCR